MDAQVVEKWNQWAKIRQDLFGIIDIVSTGNGPICGWQATATGCLSARIKKALAEPRLIGWLKSGGRFFCIGWAKRGPAGKRKVWTPKVHEFLWLEPNPRSMTQFDPHMNVSEVSPKDLKFHSDLCMCVDCIPTPEDKDCE